MNARIFSLSDGALWDTFLNYFESGPCQQFEYVAAYSKFEGDGQPYMFAVEHNEKKFAHIFIKYRSRHLDTPKQSSLDVSDISSPYGYASALSTSSDESFLVECWNLFDDWTLQERIVCEFFRGPPVQDFQCIVHPDMKLEYNRLSSSIDCKLSDQDYLSAIKQKQRNMIRRAIKENCEIVRYSLSEALPWFEPWYRQIMNKVSAPDRFYYNNEYFRRLQNLAEDLVVVSVETGNERLAAAIVIFGAQYNLYHLSVTNPDYSLNYASPFLVYGCKQVSSERNRKPLVLGGGRTTDEGDSLFRFKESMGTQVSCYDIGTRVIDSDMYEKLRSLYGSDDSKLIFYR